MLYDRILLACIIAGNWALIRILEEILPEKALDIFPKPFAMYAVLLLSVAMAVHTAWLMFAQKRRGFFYTRFESMKKASPKITTYPSVDIFVAVHNEEKVLENTISNLLELNYSNYKIYLVDDHSKDSSLKILKNYERYYPNMIKALSLAGKRGKSAALNHAFYQSSGEYIIVFDADAFVEKDFILKMLPYLDDEGVAACQCKKTISNYSYNFLTKLQENEYCVDSYFQCGKDLIQGNVELRGNGQIVKRTALLDCGLWDEETLTDDLELSTRLHLNGWQIRFCPETEVFEQGVIDINSLIKQRLRWCEGSLRRYLVNFGKIFGTGKYTSFTQKFDSFVFLCQFAVPLWLFFDVIAEIFRYFSGEQTHLTFLMFCAFSVWLVTWVNLICGIRVYRNLSWRTSVLRAFETNIYLLSMWPTIVLLTIRKILFSRTKGTWHKTEHFSELELAE